MSEPHAIELFDLPKVEPNLQGVEVVALRGRLFALYWRGALRDSEVGEPHGVVVVEFRNWHWFAGGGPNDEALHNHPLARYGLRYYTLQWIFDSPAIAPLLDTLHRDGPDRPPGYLAGLRHYVFAYKEGTFECIARGYHLTGVYPGMPAALAAITDALEEPPPWEPPETFEWKTWPRDVYQACRVEGCRAGAVRFSVFCRRHHLDRDARTPYEPAE